MLFQGAVMTMGQAPTSLVSSITTTTIIRSAEYIP
jgi:hypothetical protein